VKIDSAFDLLAGNALSHSLHQPTAQDKIIGKDFLKRNKHDIINAEVLVGADGEKCRLVAVRAASDVAKARRAQRRKDARKSAKRLSQGLYQGRLAPHVDQFNCGTGGGQPARGGLSGALGGVNPVPRMEAGVEHWQGTQPQK